MNPSMSRVGLQSVVFSAALMLANFADAAVEHRTVKYKVGDVEYVGYFAFDSANKSPRPGVLVVHEWWGLNDYARDRAHKLAALGYVAFACDMYGGGKTAAHPNEAGEMAKTVRASVDEWRKRAAAALDQLKRQPECDGSKLAAIGYCFGGSTALQLAYTGAPLQVVGVFHGSLPTPTEAEAAAVKGTVLVCQGADDSFIPDDAIRGFRSALDKAGRDYEFVVYSGTRHSFTDPDADKHNIPGLKYNAKADARSWESLKAKLQEAWGHPHP